MTQQEQTSETTDRLPTLEGHRVHLRWLDSNDIPALFDIFSDVEVARYWSTPPFVDHDAAAALVDEVHHSFRRQDLLQWGIALRETDRVIGTCTPGLDRPLQPES